MRGSYTISIRNKTVTYKIVVNRKISIIKGKSGTGKTTFVSMVSSLLQEGVDSGIHCNIKDKLCVLHANSDWLSILESTYGKIIIADEGVRYIASKQFADALSKSDNYFIFISRSGKLLNLTVSVNSVYVLKSEIKGSHVYTSAYSKYTLRDYRVVPDLIITEDKGSGYDMFKILASNLGCGIVSARGNSNIYNLVKSNVDKYNCIYAVVDGAAFGSYMPLMESFLCNTRYSVYLFCPESFEYLVLLTKYFSRYLNNELVNMEDYCDLSVYLSWEQYYTDLLSKLSFLLIARVN